MKNCRHMEKPIFHSVYMCVLLSFRVALAWISGPPTCVNLSVALCNSQWMALQDFPPPLLLHQRVSYFFRCDVPWCDVSFLPLHPTMCFVNEGASRVRQSVRTFINKLTPGSSTRTTHTESCSWGLSFLGTGLLQTLVAFESHCSVRSGSRLLVLLTDS